MRCCYIASVSVACLSSRYIVVRSSALLYTYNENSWSSACDNHVPAFADGHRLTGDILSKQSATMTTLQSQPPGCSICGVAPARVRLLGDALWMRLSDLIAIHCCCCCRSRTCGWLPLWYWLRHQASTICIRHVQYRCTVRPPTVYPCPSSPSSLHLYILEQSPVSLLPQPRSSRSVLPVKKSSSCAAGEQRTTARNRTSPLAAAAVRKGSSSPRVGVGEGVEQEYAWHASV